MQQMLRGAMFAGKNKKPAYWGLCFTAEQSNSTVSMSAAGSAPSVSLMTSTDGSNWTAFTVGTTTITLASAGDKVFFKAGSEGNARFGSSASNYNKFVLTGRVAASGDTTSLLDGDASVEDLFRDYASTKVQYTFVHLFDGCTALTKAPELPSLVLAPYAYRYMFTGCTSLSAAPVLPAYEIRNTCYGNMFEGCTSLQFVDVNVAWRSNTDTAHTSSLSSTYQWLNGVASTGTIRLLRYYGDNDTVPRSMHTCPTGWTVETKEHPLVLLGGKAISYDTAGGTQYSNDLGRTWNDWDGASLSVSSTYTLTMFAAKTPRTNIYNKGFKSTSTFLRAGGSIASLLSKDLNVGSTGGADAFRSAFNGNTRITSAKNVKMPEWSTVGDRCCQQMFYGCTALTSAPALPATSLAPNCYYGMFYNCSSLVSAPALPATSLATNCYYSMFYSCTSLTSAPALPATTLATACYLLMFYSCTSLTSAPALPATSLATDCYRQMFYKCSSLVSAPTLSATSLAMDCYNNMFSGCTSLTSAPALPATTLVSGCYNNMFSGCTSLTSAPALSATSLATRCYNYMFSGCTSLTSANVSVSASSLPQNALSYMFSGCTSLADASNVDVAVSGNADYLGASEMFSNCTGLTSLASISIGGSAAGYSLRNMYAGCTALSTVNFTSKVSVGTWKADCCFAFFKGCTSLSDVAVGFTSWPTDASAADAPLFGWLDSVAASGTFRCPAALGTDSTISRGTSYCPTGWTVVNI